MTSKTGLTIADRIRRPMSRSAASDVQTGTQKTTMGRAARTP